MADHPATIYEQIAADYPHYTIRRENDGDWVATHKHTQVKTTTLFELATHLPEHELARLQKTFGDHYRVWRTPTMWIATRRIDNGTERTLMRHTPTELEEGMLNPPKGIRG